MSASLLGCDLGAVAEGVATAEKSGCDELHIDIMDGHFTPNIALGLPIAAAVRPLTKLPCEAHMMVAKPTKYVKDYAPFCDIYTFHIESGDDPLRTVELIHDSGLQAGVAVNPDTSLDALDNVLGVADRILVMSVVPGKAGQPFLKTVLPKISDLKDKLSKAGGRATVAVDGGVKVANSAQILKSGAQILVMATGFYNYKDGPEQAVKLIRGSGM